MVEYDWLGDSPVAAMSEVKPLDREQLQALQTELQALKTQYGRALRLHRATSSEAPATTPFPILLTFTVDAPDAASHYDVTSVSLQIGLSRECLIFPQQAASAATAMPSASAPPGGSAALQTHESFTSPPPGASLTLLPSELPARLRTRVEAELCRAWNGALGYAPSPASSPAGPKAAATSGPYRLSAPVSYLQEHFVPLICLIPELVEPYQAEDEYGATVRRYAIINTDDVGSVATETAAPAGVATVIPVGTLSADPGQSAHQEAPGRVQGRSTGSVDPGSTAFGAAAAARAATPGALGAAVQQQEGQTSPGEAVAAHAEKAGAAAEATPRGLHPSPLQPQQQGVPPPTQHASRPEVPSSSVTAAQGLSGDPMGGATSGLAGLSSAAAPACASTAGAPPQPPAHLPSPAAQPHHHHQPTQPTVSDPPPSSVATSSAHHPSNAPAPPPAPAAPPAPAPPPGLLLYDVALKELQYIQKRYSQVFNARVIQDGPAAPAPAAARGTGGSAASGSAAALLKPEALTTFELELLPTDPDWDFPAVRLVGQLLPVDAFHYLPSLGVHMASRLPPWLRAAVEDYLAQQLAAEAATAAAAAVLTAGDVERPGGAASEALELGPPGLGAGSHERGGRGGGGCRGGAGGRGAGLAAASAAVAPEGTVLLPLGTLRNLFRNLENYAGGVARAAEEDRRRLEGGGEAAAGGSGPDSGGQYSSGDDSDGGLQYDDDGYGDGSGRRGGPEGGEGSAEEDAGGGEGGDSDGERDEIRFTGTANVGDIDAPTAYGVVLEGLQLDNLAVAEVLRANFEVCCARCGSRGAIRVSSSAVDMSGLSASGRQRILLQTASTVCERCTAEWALQMKPHYVHATSNSLCILKPEGCRPLDLLPSLMAGQCAGCNAVMTLRDVQVGFPFTRNCSSCHKELLISVAAVSFIPRVQLGAGRGPSAPPAGRIPRAIRGGGGGAAAGPVLRPGQPLPALGTCKHYRHSYRWLRFPCCGMRYPCDLCHEEAVPDGHNMRWAQRMVCGFCSTEQPLGLACRACERQLAGTGSNPSGRRTRFWEGGTGCREPRRLNKNDPHKFRGRNKTQSAKSSRVGPKPWSGKGGASRAAGSG